MIQIVMTIGSAIFFIALIAAVILWFRKSLEYQLTAIIRLEDGSHHTVKFRKPPNGFSVQLPNEDNKRQFIILKEAIVGGGMQPKYIVFDYRDSTPIIPLAKLEYEKLRSDEIDAFVRSSVHKQIFSSDILDKLEKAVMVDRFIMIGGFVVLALVTFFAVTSAGGPATLELNEQNLDIIAQAVLRALGRG